MTPIGTIKEILPHRYPMLLVDRVVATVAGESLVALKAITRNEPCFCEAPGERPDGDSYPMALLIESWCQAAGLLVAWDQPNPDVRDGKVMLFGGLSGIHFLRPALPGDVVEHRVRLIRAVGDVAILEGEALVDGSAIMQVERVVMAQRPAESLLRPDALRPDASLPAGGSGPEREEVGSVR